MGYVGWIGGNLGIGQEQTHEEESQAVSELLSLGAVLYCKTSLPQTLLVGHHDMKQRPTASAKLRKALIENTDRGDNQQHHRPYPEPA